MQLDFAHLLSTDTCFVAVGYG